MKKIFLIGIMALVIVSAFVSLALANPFLVCDPAPASDQVTQAQVTINGVAGAWIPYATQTIGGTVYCVLQDLAPLASGSHTVTAKFRNTWGDSVASAPFTFTKSIPGAPSGMAIK